VQSGDLVEQPERLALVEHTGKPPRVPTGIVSWSRSRCVPMTGAMSLLGGLLRLREQSVLERPAVGNQLDDAPRGPAGFELGNDVDQVVPCAEAEISAGLNQGVGSCQAPGAVEGASEKDEIAPLWWTPGKGLRSPEIHRCSTEGHALIRSRKTPYAA
jgi:hypothetical protein